MCDYSRFATISRRQQSANAASGFLFFLFLPARHCASAGTIAMAVCLCLSVSVTSRCSIELDGRIDPVFDIQASCDQSYTVLYGNSDIHKNKGTSVWNFVPNSGLRKLCFSISIAKRVTNLARQRWTLKA